MNRGLGPDDVLEVGTDDVLEVGTDDVLEVGTDDVLEVGTDDVLEVGTDGYLRGSSEYASVAHYYPVMRSSDQLEFAMTVQHSRFYHIVFVPLNPAYSCVNDTVPLGCCCTSSYLPTTGVALL
jgi:hypothetical protein